MLTPSDITFITAASATTTTARPTAMLKLLALLVLLCFHAKLPKAFSQCKAIVFKWQVFTHLLLNTGFLVAVGQRLKTKGTFEQGTLHSAVQISASSEHRISVNPSVLSG